MCVCLCWFLLVACASICVSSGCVSSFCLFGSVAAAACIAAMAPRKRRASLLDVRDPVKEAELARDARRQEKRELSAQLRLLKRKQHYRTRDREYDITARTRTVARLVCVLSGMSVAATERFCARKANGNSGQPSQARECAQSIHDEPTANGMTSFAILACGAAAIGRRRQITRAIEYVAEHAVFEWVLAANMKGVFPWTQDMATQLVTEARAVATREPAAAEHVARWLEGADFKPEFARSWGRRFRRRWGLKYGRGIILTPLSQSELEKKAGFFSLCNVFFFVCGWPQNWGHFLTPKSGT